MPDPTLNSDLTERLLEPTTDAAVRHTFSRITHMPIGNEGLTIEALMRDMLRPMLKEWLDENLPTVVERMVEKEIARVSRGLE
jgi:cell pole-organizing protein PopZ